VALQATEPYTGPQAEENIAYVRQLELLPIDIPVSYMVVKNWTAPTIESLGRARQLMVDEGIDNDEIDYRIQYGLSIASSTRKRKTRSQKSC